MRDMMDKRLFDTKLDRKTVTDLVYEKIAGCIKDGVWAVGEKLPSEGELAEMFNVNRLTVRLVLQKLSTLGVVETKNGVGTRIIAFDFDNYIDEASDFIISDDLLKDITDYRMAIELPCADLAIDRASDEEIEVLRGLVNDYMAIESEVSLESPHEAFVRLIDADIAFHKQIVTMSGNTLFVYAFKVCESVIFEHMMRLMKARARSIQDEARTTRFHEIYENIHANIYQAIKDRDKEACRKHYMKMLLTDDDCDHIG